MVLSSCSSLNKVLLEDARLEEVLAVVSPQQLEIRLSNLRIPLSVLP